MKYKETQAQVGMSINEAVQHLQTCWKNGEYVAMTFNNHVLYSDKVTLDSAYIECTGVDKRTYDVLCDHNGLFARGRAMLPQSHAHDWEHFAFEHAGNQFSEKAMHEMLDTIYALDHGFTNYDNIVNQLSQYSVEDQQMAVQMLGQFSDHGKGFIQRFENVQDFAAIGESADRFR